MTYNYSKEIQFGQRKSYSYSPYLGPQFLADWVADRDAAFGRIQDETPWVIEAGDGRLELEFTLSDDFLAEPFLEWLKAGFFKSGDGRASRYGAYLDKFVKRFEATQKIYRRYNAELRPVDKAAYTDISDYLLFAETLSVAYAKSENLVYLNSLLKCVDVICSPSAGCDMRLHARLASIISEERRHVRELCARLNVAI